MLKGKIQNISENVAYIYLKIKFLLGAHGDINIVIILYIIYIFPATQKTEAGGWLELIESSLGSLEDPVSQNRSHKTNNNKINIPPYFQILWILVRILI